MTSPLKQSPSASNSFGLSAETEKSGFFQFVIKSPSDAVDFKTRIQSDLTVFDLKNQLSVEHPNKPLAEDQRLIFAGKILSNNSLLSNIFSSSLVSKIDGGNSNIVLHMVLKKEPKNIENLTAKRKFITEMASVNNNGTGSTDQLRPSGNTAASSSSNSALPTQLQQSSFSGLSDAELADIASKGQVVYIKGLPYLMVPSNSEPSPTATPSISRILPNLAANGNNPIDNDFLRNIDFNRVRIRVFRIPSLTDILNNLYSLLRIALFIYVFWPREQSSSNYIFYAIVIGYILQKFGLVNVAINRFNNGTMPNFDFTWVMNNAAASVFITFVASFVPGFENFIRPQANVEEENVGEEDLAQEASEQTSDDKNDVTTTSNDAEGHSSSLNISQQGEIKQRSVEAK